MTVIEDARATGAQLPPGASLPVYQASSTKQRRRTQTEIAELRAVIYNIVREDPPMTVRHIFYRVAALGLVEKTKQGYDNIIGRQVKLMRRAGELPYSWITDGTRYRIKPESYSDVDEMLEDAAASYRRALWHDQNAYVEIWTEKDAIAGILNDVTDKWDVPLLVQRGFNSETFVWASAEEIRRQGKPTYLYYFGDHDPSGEKAANDTRRRLLEFASDIEIHWEQAAVTPEQIEEWQLPTRPTKAGDNRHARNWTGGDSVDVDAISPSRLRALVEDCITRHIDQAAYAMNQRIEAEERAGLHALIKLAR